MTADLNDIDEAFVALCDLISDEAIVLRVLAEADGTTYPAMVNIYTDEVVGLLCIPPRVYAWGTVN